MEGGAYELGGAVQDCTLDVACLGWGKIGDISADSWFKVSGLKLRGPFFRGPLYH